MLLNRIRFVLILIALLLTAFFLHDLVSAAKNLPQQIKNSSQQAKASPQQTKNSPQQIKESENLDQLKAEIANYLQNYKGQYGVYYYDLTTGQEFGINDEDQFTSASCEKVPMNLYLYQQIQSGAVNPQAL